MSILAHSILVFKKPAKLPGNFPDTEYVVEIAGLSEPFIGSTVGTGPKILYLQLTA